MVHFVAYSLCSGNILSAIVTVERLEHPSSKRKSAPAATAVLLLPAKKVLTKRGALPLDKISDDSPTCIFPA